MLDSLRRLLDRFAKPQLGGYVVNGEAAQRIQRAQFAAAWGHKTADDIAARAKRRAITSFRSARWWERHLQQQHREAQIAQYLAAGEDWSWLPGFQAVSCPACGLRHALHEDRAGDIIRCDEDTVDGCAAELLVTCEAPAGEPIRLKLEWLQEGSAADWRWHTPKESDAPAS